MRKKRKRKKKKRNLSRKKSGRVLPMSALQVTDAVDKRRERRRKH